MLFASNPLKIVRLARVICAAMLLLAFVSASVPLVTFAATSANSCALACCAGKAPHAAGSCEHGSCHAALPWLRESSKHRQRVSQPTEQLCGVPRGLEIKSVARRDQVSSKTAKKNIRALPYGRASDTNQFTDTKQPKLATASLTMPCQPECGGCLAGFSNSSQRNTAVIDHGLRLRPLAKLLPARRDDSSPGILDALSEHWAPRGPPLSLS